MNKISTKIISLLIVCTMLLTLVSCSKDSWVPAGMKLASTDAVDYTLYVPESWTVDISTGVLSAYVSDTDRSNITMAAMNLSGDDAYMTLDEYWAKYEADIISTFPDMKYVDYSSEDDESEDDDAALNEEAETEAETEAPYSESGNKNNNPVSTLLGGSAANKYYYTATVTGTEIQYMQVVCIRGGIVYIFTYTAIPDNFDNHIEDVESILTNFSFDN